MRAFSLLGEEEEEAGSSPTDEYREEAMLVGCGEPAVNMMKTGSTVR